MIYRVERESSESSSYKIIKSFFTVYIWAIDGWTYSITEKKRRRYFYEDFNFFMEEEDYHQMSIPRCLYKEELHKHIISYEPLKWIEEGVDFKELYVSLPHK